MQAINTLLYILLFILCLSVLIIVHEFGHFATSKMFNIYVQEFSIGFGPKLFRKKRKNGETYFSLRALPFGGYVSFIDKGMKLENGEDPDPKRMFSSAKKWKRAIVLVAGVFNNALLALLLFFISESVCVQKAMYLIENKEQSNVYYSYVEVLSDSKAAELGILNESQINFYKVSTVDETKSVLLLDKDALLTYNDDSSETVAAVIDVNSATFTSRNYQSLIHFYPYGAGEDFEGIDLNNEIIANKQNLKDIKFSMDIKNKGEDTFSAYTFEVKPINGSEGSLVFNDVGISFYIDEYYNDIGTAFKNTFIDFGESSVAIVQGFGQLFTDPSSWKNVGGIIQIGVITTSALENIGIGRFIYIWGLISVNLAIVNLLPFPGLDGWQLLVLIVEAIAHREIPDKVKNWFSIIGMLLLFTLTILIVIKDIVGLI